MSESTRSAGVPESVARVLRRFEAMGREEKMQALLQYARKLEPLPERYATVDRSAYTIPECQTRVDLFPELHDGKMHYYADVNARQSPTVAAVLAVVLAAVNEQPPETTLAIPPDFVSALMNGMGLHARETGLNAMITRLKRYAREARDRQARDREADRGSGAAAEATGPS